MPAPPACLPARLSACVRACVPAGVASAATGNKCRAMGGRQCCAAQPHTAHVAFLLSSCFPAFFLPACRLAPTARRSCRAWGWQSRWGSPSSSWIALWASTPRVRCLPARPRVSRRYFSIPNFRLSYGLCYLPAADCCFRREPQPAQQGQGLRVGASPALPPCVTASGLPVSCAIETPCFQPL